MPNPLADLPIFQTIQDPQRLIAEVVERFGSRAAIGTSGQLTGMVMVDMALRAGVKPRVFLIDTQRLFSETYQLVAAVEKKYQIQVERVQAEPKRLAAMLEEHGEYLFFDSKQKQELCCQIRKVEPNQRVLESLDVWLTGLRTDQSSRRAATLKFETLFQGEERRPLLKIAPLVDWTEAQLREYCQKYQVPIHPLLEQAQAGGWYYESLGCVICTTPIGPHEPRRAGRWRWFQQEGDSKECGLHVTHKDEP